MPGPRDLGLLFWNRGGPHNSIIDVPGLRVGHVPLVSGEGAGRYGLV